MRVVCGPPGFDFPVNHEDLAVDLYAQPREKNQASAGQEARLRILRAGLQCDPHAWDLLSIALSVIAADLALLRQSSPDGWTREIELHIGVGDADLWQQQSDELNRTLRFLTTDRWSLHFHSGEMAATKPKRPKTPNEDSVVLLSGGLDSLVGAIDLTSCGNRPLAVSQVVRGNAVNQARLASAIGNGMPHVALSHAARTPGIRELSQRSRSLGFIAFGALVATGLASYREGATVPLYICENGFISLNPPLVGNRIGSLTTRTTHPEFIARLQGILDATDLRVQLKNPYTTKTKGEMLQSCADQDLLRVEAPNTTSCGRFLRLGYKQCGRCIPCQVRRASFLAWGVNDSTEYLYTPIGNPGSDFSAFDDVRAVALALSTIDTHGIKSWLGNRLPSRYTADRAAIISMVKRSMNELRALHQEYGIS